MTPCPNKPCGYSCANCSCCECQCQCVEDRMRQELKALLHRQRAAETADSLSRDAGAVHRAIGNRVRAHMSMWHARERGATRWAPP